MDDPEVCYLVHASPLPEQYPQIELWQFGVYEVAPGGTFQLRLTNENPSRRASQYRLRIYEEGTGWGDQQWESWETPTEPLFLTVTAPMELGMYKYLIQGKCSHGTSTTKMTCIQVVENVIPHPPDPGPEPHDFSVYLPITIIE